MIVFVYHNTTRYILCNCYIATIFSDVIHRKVLFLRTFFSEFPLIAQNERENKNNSKQTVSVLREMYSSMGALQFKKIERNPEGKI